MSGAISITTGGRKRVDWSLIDARLLALREDGLRFADIGAHFGLSKDTVRRRWQFLTGQRANPRSDGWKPSGDLLKMRQVCAEAFDLTEAELMGRSRFPRIAQPRMAICYIMRTARPKLSYPCIAAMLGGRDHSTIIHAVRKTEARMARNRALAEKVEALVAMFARRSDVRQHDAHVALWREFQRLVLQRDAMAAIRRIEAERKRAEAEAEARRNSDDEFLAALDARKVFCGQCDRAVTPEAAARCSARLCGLRAREAA